MYNKNMASLKCYSHKPNLSTLTYLTDLFSNNSTVTWFNLKVKQGIDQNLLHISQTKDMAFYKQ